MALNTYYILFTVLLIVSQTRTEDDLDDHEDLDSPYDHGHGAVESFSDEEHNLQEKRSLPFVPVGNVEPYVATGLGAVGGQLIGQQVEITNNVAVPIVHYRVIPAPYPQPVPVAIHVPVKVPQPVPVPVYKTVPVPVDKPVIVPKPYPVKVVKEVPVPKPYPVPVYKTKHIYHIAIPKHNAWW